MNAPHFASGTRGRGIGLVLLTATLALYPRTSWAQSKDALRQSAAASPQNFALEIRIGQYYPKVDSEPALGGRTPFRDVFGERSRFQVGIEFDWQALRIPHFGSLGPGLGIGYTKFGGVANRAGTKIPSAQATNLEIYPFQGVAVLRVDVLANELHIPIVPYGKAGVGLGLWRAYGPTGTETNGDTRGKGMSWGTHFALGAAVQFDFLDRGSAKTLDIASGINHTYGFVEYISSNLDGFGSTKALHVGTNNWAAGLAFEF
jgi:hypothetical protein